MNTTDKAVTDSRTVASVGTQTLEQLQASYIRKVESGELYETQSEQHEREQFPLTFWHKKFYNVIGL